MCYLIQGPPWRGVPDSSRYLQLGADRTPLTSDLMTSPSYPVRGSGHTRLSSRFSKPRAASSYGSCLRGGLSRPGFFALPRRQ